MKKVKKQFDAVAFQRKVREELSKKYFDNPDLLKKDMERIREKYGLKQSKKYKISHSNSSIAAEPPPVPIRHVRAGRAPYRKKK